MSIFNLTLNRYLCRIVMWFSWPVAEAYADWCCFVSAFRCEHGLCGEHVPFGNGCCVVGKSLIAGKLLEHDSPWVGNCRYAVA